MLFKIRPCINSATEAELLILKLLLRQAISSGSEISYRNRMFILIRDQFFHIMRSGDPETCIEVPRGRAGDAVDRFIEGFVYETGSTILDVIIHKSDIDSVGWRWAFLSAVDPMLQLLLNKITYETFHTLTTKRLEWSEHSESITPV
jgi:hypothetical protein